MIKLGTNILSQTVQRNLGRATQDLSKASERLSSGQRINRASDDAAGLAISMSLDKDRILARTAQRNVSDGISMVSILSSGLSSQKEILFRMSELAEQSANGTYSSQQREVLQKEYGSLMDEFDRIADSSEFNGVKLLRNVTPQTIQFMAGITGADSSLLQVVAANSHRYAGMVSQKSDVNGSGIVNTTDAAITVGLLTQPRNSLYSTGTPVYLKGEEQQDAGEIRFKDSAGNSGSLTFLLFRIWGDIGTLPKNGSGAETISTTANRQDLAYNAVLDSGEQINSQVQLTFSSSQSVPSTVNLSLTFATAGTTAAVGFDFSSLNFESFDSTKSSYSPSAIGFTNILNQYSSKRALTIVKNRIDNLSQIEGQYGAIESRLNVAHNLLASSGENFAAAGSRIKDADIANEAATSVRSGILQQAASALLAQANQAPQIALSLLR